MSSRDQNDDHAELVNIASTAARTSALVIVIFFPFILWNIERRAHHNPPVWQAFARRRNAVA